MKINDVIKVLVTKVHHSYVKVQYQGKESTLQITELTWKTGKLDVSQYVKEGEEIRVKVIKLDGERFSVSMKQALLGGDPWLNAPHVGDEFFAPIVSITDYGVLLELSYFCRALLLRENISQEYQLGDRITVKVVSSNPERQRIEVIET